MLELKDLEVGKQYRHIAGELHEYFKFTSDTFTVSEIEGEDVATYDAMWRGDNNPDHRWWITCEDEEGYSLLRFEEIAPSVQQKGNSSNNKQVKYILVLNADWVDEFQCEQYRICNTREQAESAMVECMTRGGGFGMNNRFEAGDLSESDFKIIEVSSEFAEQLETTLGKYFGTGII